MKGFHNRETTITEEEGKRGEVAQGCKEPKFLPEMNTLLQNGPAEHASCKRFCVSTTRRRGAVRGGLCESLPWHKTRAHFTQRCGITHQS